MEVTVTRTTNQYRRSVNGAWLGAGSEATEIRIDEAKLDKRFSLNNGIRVTWPDGVTESAFPFNGGACPGYPPICYPADGRLAALLKRDPTPGI